MQVMEAHMQAAQLGGGVDTDAASCGEEDRAADGGAADGGGGGGSSDSEDEDLMLMPDLDEDEEGDVEEGRQQGGAQHSDDPSPAFFASLTLESLAPMLTGTWLAQMAGPASPRSSRLTAWPGWPRNLLSTSRCWIMGGARPNAPALHCAVHDDAVRPAVPYVPHAHRPLHVDAVCAAALP